MDTNSNSAIAARHKLIKRLTAPEPPPPLQELPPLLQELPPPQLCTPIICPPGPKGGKGYPGHFGHPGRPGEKGDKRDIGNEGYPEQKGEGKPGQYWNQA